MDLPLKKRRNACTPFNIIFVYHSMGDSNKSLSRAHPLPPQLGHCLHCCSSFSSCWRSWQCAPCRCSPVPALPPNAAPIAELAGRGAAAILVAEVMVAEVVLVIAVAVAAVAVGIQLGQGIIAMIFWLILLMMCAQVVLKVRN
jgi:hypothetical protein